MASPGKILCLLPTSTETLQKWRIALCFGKWVASFLWVKTLKKRSVGITCPVGLYLYKNERYTSWSERKSETRGKSGGRISWSTSREERRGHSHKVNEIRCRYLQVQLTWGKSTASQAADDLRLAVMMLVWASGRKLGDGSIRGEEQGRGHLKQPNL